MKAAFTIAALLIPLFVFAQNKVGINTDSPEFKLDIRSLDDVLDAPDLQLATPSQNHFLRLFGGRDGDPKPFLLFSNQDTFRIATSTSAFAEFTERMTVLPEGNIGIGISNPLNKLHVHDDSTYTTPPPLELTLGKNIALQITNGVSGDSATAGLLAGVTAGGTGLVSSPTTLEVTAGQASLRMFGNVVSVDSNLWLSGNLNMSHLAGSEDLNIVIGTDGNFKTAPVIVADTDWTEGGGFVYNISNYIGVGTDIPSAQLMVSGEENNGNKASMKIHTDAGGGSGNTLLADGNEMDVFASGGATDRLSLQSNSSGDVDMVNGGGFVGVGGLPVVDRKLHVKGADILPGQDLSVSPAAICISSNEVSNEMLIDGDAIETVNNNLHLNQYSLFDVTLAEGGGHVGVGSSSPFGRLTIHGPDNDGTFGTLRLVEFGGFSDMLMDGDEIDVVYGNALHLNANSRKPVTIGTDTIATGFALSVKGRIMTDEVQVQLIDTWPDYVFAEDYPLMPLDQLEASIRQNNHLPGLPTAEEVSREGIALGEMQRQMLEKIEELTLHVISLHKRMETLERENAELHAQLKK